MKFPAITNLFRDKKFYQVLFVLALPIMIQNFIASSLNMVDTVMIGAIGEDEVAAVGIANQIFFFLTLTLNGITGGCSVFISQYWGKRDITSIKKIVGIGFWGSALVGVVFTLLALLFGRPILGLFSSDAHVITLANDYLFIVAFSYIMTAISFLGASTLRCMENTKAPMVVSVAALLINTLLNYLLIFGKIGLPAMGVRGAALATLIARTVEALFILLFIFWRNSPLAGNVREYMMFSRKLVRSVFITIAPALGNESTWGLGSIMQTVAFGLIGTSAIAAIQICGTVRGLFLVLAFSIANSAVVMIGNAIGAGDEERAKDYAHKFSILAFGTGLILGVLLFVLAPVILHFFNVSTDVVDASVRILRIYAITLAPLVLNCVTIAGTMRGGGDVKYALVAEGATMWFIAVPFAFLGAAVFHLPVEQVAMLIAIEEVAKCICCIVRLSGDKWLHNMIKETGSMNVERETEC